MDATSKAKKAKESNRDLIQRLNMLHFSLIQIQQYIIPLSVQRNMAILQARSQVKDLAIALAFLIVENIFST